jgi:hypothetical protein
MEMVDTQTHLSIPPDGLSGFKICPTVSLLLLEGVTLGAPGAYLATVFKSRAFK